MPIYFSFFQKIIKIFSILIILKIWKQGWKWNKLGTKVNPILYYLKFHQCKLYMYNDYFILYMWRIIIKYNIILR